MNIIFTDLNNEQLFTTLPVDNIVISEQRGIKKAEVAFSIEETSALDLEIMEEYMCPFVCDNYRKGSTIRIVCEDKYGDIIFDGNTRMEYLLFYDEGQGNLSRKK